MLSKEEPMYNFLERDRLIWENFDDLIIVADPIQNFKIEYFNEDSFEQLLRYNNKDLMGKSFLKYIHPDDLKKYKDLNNKYAFDDQVREIRIVTKNGNYKWFELIIKEFRNSRNQQKLFINLRDISRLKDLELRLKESENRFEKVINLVPEIRFKDILYQKELNKTINSSFQLPNQNEAIFHAAIESLPFDFFMINKNNKYLTLNTNFKDNWGDVTGKHPEDISNDKDTLALWKENHKRAFSGETVISEVNCKVNGNLRYFYNIITPVYIDDRIEYIQGVNIDITELKITEQKLIESEEKFRIIAEQSFMGIAILQDDVFKYCNEHFLVINGYNIEEIKNWRANEFSKMIHPEDREFVLEQARKKQFGEKDVTPHYIFRIIRKDGEIRWVENFSKTINYRGRPADFIMNRDITDTILAEQKLKESEEKFRTIAEQARMGICIIQDSKVEYINQQISDIYGYSLAEIYNMESKEFIKLIHPDLKKKKVNQIIKKQQDFKDLFKPSIVKAIRKNREEIWVESFSNAILYHGQPADLLIQTDITEKKEAEEKLKESEAKYYELFETSPNGVILTELNGKILECNSSIKIITGYSPKKFVGKNFRDLEFYSENALDILLKAYNDLLDNKKVPYIEIPIKRKDNDICWIQIGSNLLYMKGKKFIIAVIHDITSQKQAEEALKRSEEKYRALLETTSLGVIEIDGINGKMKYINPKLLEIIGYAREELSEDKFQNDIINKKDLPKLLRTIGESELEFRIVDKQGKEKLLAGKRIPQFNEKGEITSISVWLDDITEKKMYEELIYELNINFLNFTADIRKNIELLLNTAIKLLKGDIILYIQEIKYNSRMHYQVIDSENNIYTFEENDFFENLFMNEVFYEGHDFPQTFFDINMKKYAKTDPFIKKYEVKGCIGKVIKSHHRFKSALGVFYKENPVITGQENLIMFLICDAIEIEQRRWQVQRDLEEQNITLNKINKLKTELFSRTSHELKTPLISIKGFTELLLTIHHKKFDKEVISILEEIKDGSKRLEKIINSLLESTKLEAGQLELNPSEEDLTFLIKFCVKEIRGLASLRDQSILLDLHQKLETKFDKERIYEVISNLIVNAIKYTPPGGHIRIKSEIKDNEYIISIQDDGIGFTEEEKSQVFTQFGKIERYGQGWDVATEGSGLGLYITKKLIELHGGKIWLESGGRNKGSTFYFSIPKN